MTEEKFIIPNVWVIDGVEYIVKVVPTFEYTDGTESAEKSIILLKSE